MIAVQDRNWQWITATGAMTHFCEGNKARKPYVSVAEVPFSKDLFEEMLGDLWGSRQSNELSAGRTSEAPTQPPSLELIPGEADTMSGPSESSILNPSQSPFLEQEPQSRSETSSSLPPLSSAPEQSDTKQTTTGNGRRKRRTKKAGKKTSSE